MTLPGTPSQLAMDTAGTVWLVIVTIVLMELYMVRLVVRGYAPVSLGSFERDISLFTIL